jgi:PAS domain S-box-containing protein
MRRLVVVLRNPYFWLLLAFFVLCVMLHYAEQIPFLQVKVSSVLGLGRHSIERILFLALVILGSLTFGLKGGIIYLSLSFAAMLPRAIFFSPDPPDALFETVGVSIVGGGVIWWLESRQREIGRREQALLKLEAVRRELQSYIQTIQENEKRLSVLYSITTAINQLVSLDEIINTAADKVMEVVDIDGLLVFLLDEEANELVVRAHRGVSDDFARQVDRLKVGEGFNGWVAQTGEPAMIEDSSTDPRLTREIVRKEGAVSQFIVPLMSREKVVGTLSVVSRTTKVFLAEERQLLQLIGTELGVAVERAALDEQSRLAGKRFQELFEKAHDAIWVQDSEGRIVTANQATADFTGYTLDELVGMKVAEFLQPEGLELAREIRRKLLSGEEVAQPYEQRVTRKDGSEAVIMLTTSLIADEGSPPVFQHISRDVTQEKLLQENLRLYARQITRAQEEERKRIARELHDDPIQAMVVLSRRIDDLATSDAMDPQCITRLENIREEVDEILGKIRIFTQDLRPPTIDYLGLLPALRELVSQWQSQSGIECKLQTTGTERHFTAEDELLIYRLVQEALNNVWRHAEAKKVRVTVKFNADKAIVEVKDDGKGFEMEEDLRFVQTGKIGLAGMQERASLLGGTLNIYSKPGKGTRVVLEVPSTLFLSGVQGR